MNKPASNPLIEALTAAADRCVKCGMCSTVCPSYTFYQNELESPRGRISLIQQLLQEGRLGEQAEHHLDNCLHCYACERMCPAEVPYQDLISYYLSATPRSDGENTLSQRRLIQLGSKLRNQPLVNALVSRLLPQSQQRLWHHLPRQQKLKMDIHPKPARLPGHPPQSKMDIHNKNILSGQPSAVPIRQPSNSAAQRGPNKARPDLLPINIFAGCTTELLDQDTRYACERLLGKLGYSPAWTEDALCCGALAKHGHQQHLFEQQRQALETRWQMLERPILSFNSGCERQLREHDLAVTTLFDWLVEQVFPLQKTALRIALHAPCSSQGAPPHRQSLPALLDRGVGTWTQIPSSLGCCGAAGAHMINNPALSDASREATVFWIQEQSPDLVLSSNIGCRLHIQAGLEALGLDIPVKHPIWLLNELVEG